VGEKSKFCPQIAKKCNKNIILTKEVKFNPIKRENKRITIPGESSCVFTN
jgi:hypothetical protein